MGGVSIARVPLPIITGANILWSLLKPPVENVGVKGVEGLGGVTTHD